MTGAPLPARAPAPPRVRLPAETSGASPERLWRKHTARVEAIARERGSTIPPHDLLAAVDEAHTPADTGSPPV